VRWRRLRHPEIMGIFSDPQIERCLTCGASPAVGTDADVGNLLQVQALATRVSTAAG